MSLTFEPIHPQSTNIPRCSQLLVNRMQCTRAAEFWVVDSTVEDFRPYAVCAHHKNTISAELVTTVREELNELEQEQNSNVNPNAEPTKSDLSPQHES